METDKNIKKTLHDIEHIEEEILSCLSNLNLLEYFSPDELGMTEAEIVVEREESFTRITRLQEELLL